MADDVALEAYVNPLVLFSLEDAWMTSDEPECEAVLRDVCAKGSSTSLALMKERCTEVPLKGNALAVVPAEKHILGKLIWPLRNARSCYVLGNYIGTLALCGMMAEMAAILIFDIAEPQHDGEPIDRGKQVELYGCRFEKLGQECRTKVLRDLGIIRGELVDAFDTVRRTRRRYLHLWSYDHGAAAKDAARVFEAAVLILTTLLGIKIVAGKPHLTPAMVKYLKKRGLYEPAPSSRG